VEPGEEVRLRQVAGVEEVLLEVGDRVAMVEAVRPNDRTLLAEILEANLPFVGWLVRNKKLQDGGCELLIQVHRFQVGQFWPDEAQIGLDEKIVEQLERRPDENLRGAADAARWLGEQLLLPPRRPGDPWRAFLSAGPGGPSGRETAFRLHGCRVDADIRRSEEGKLLIERVTPCGKSRGAVAFLTCASLGFCDVTVASKFRAEAQSQLDELVRRSGSYLRAWQEYSRLEWETLLRRAREFGWVRYRRCDIDPEGRYIFHLETRDELDAQFEFLFSLDKAQVEASAELPPELLQPGNEKGISEDRLQERARDAVPRFVGMAERPARRGTWEKLRLRPLDEADGDKEPPASGFLFLSLHGDRVRQQRRDIALRMVRETRSAMPHLGLLLEGRPVPSVRRKRVNPLSPAIREVFGGEPTIRQIEALDVALNTPDIALIQGPPGTGKTKVIAALAARLAEVDRKAGREVSGRIFLGSESRNAVAHAASGTEVFGLPAINLSNRGSDGVSRWRRRQEERVRIFLADRPTAAGDPLRRVQALHASLVKTPGGPAGSADVLRQVEESAALLLPAGLRDRLRQRTLELRRQASLLEAGGSRERNAAIRAVRALRTTALSFPDGGRDNAYFALRKLEPLEILSPEERALLERASSADAPDACLLRGLATTKIELLARLNRPRAVAGTSGVDIVTQAIVAEVIDVLNDRLRGSRAGVDAVLERYLDDLRNDPHGVRQALREYTVVLADTIQKAAGKAVRRMKSEDVVYDTVIIDEAARATPLDLLISMIRASRRIVLVGDHRQLPHMLEPDVERELERPVHDEIRENLRKSLFWRLFELLKAREAEDGVRRVVTLNTQYRMHPVLGSFVSRVFYEPHREACIEPGREEREFIHNLPEYIGKVGAWIDVPLSQGAEIARRSKSRPVEAGRLATELARLMEAAPDLTFGVISFYAAQVDVIWRALREVGVAEEQEDGSFQIAARHQTGAGERLRVGTVDAFQGMEFDVVMLSLTRSNGLLAKDEVGRRRKFGHLLLENRLNVAMSRQKRLLIVVGDRGMIQDDVEGLRPLVVFDRELCGGPHGIHRV
jgi:hypothetical protein